MVAATRIELVTPAMSRQCSPTELRDQIDFEKYSDGHVKSQRGNAGQIRK